MISASGIHWSMKAGSWLMSAVNQEWCSVVNMESESALIHHWLLTLDRMVGWTPSFKISLCGGLKCGSKSPTATRWCLLMTGAAPAGTFSCPIHTFKGSTLMLFYPITTIRNGFTWAGSHFNSYRRLTTSLVDSGADGRCHGWPEVCGWEADQRGMGERF